LILTELYIMQSNYSSSHCRKFTRSNTYLQRKGAAVKIAAVMKVRLFLFLILCLISLPGCGRKKNVLQIKGSDTIVNAVQMISEEFAKENPQIEIAITGGGSGVGIASLISKTTNIATASREITQKEIGMARNRGIEPNETIIGFDGVALIVNKNNPVSQLTINQLRGIFTGEKTNWKDFGGPDRHIVTLSREVSSGTYAYFKDVVVKLGKKAATDEFSSETLLLSSSQAIVEEVSVNDAAIGYLGMGYVSDRTKTLSVAKNDEFIVPDVNSVLSKKYPLSRPLYFFTNGQPEGITKLFVDFTLSPRGQKLMVESGFVPRIQFVAQEN
jgi:phosphate transport system substrate-binding protein